MNAWNDLGVDKKIILKCNFRINIVFVDLIRVAHDRNSKSLTSEHGNRFLVERTGEGIF
jgi:hypothetical protein